MIKARQAYDKVCQYYLRHNLAVLLCIMSIFVKDKSDLGSNLNLKTPQSCKDHARTIY